MLDILKNKKVIFFDVGYTLDYPASGDWMLTNKFYEVSGEQLKQFTNEQIQNAKNVGMDYLNRNHHIKTEEEECEQYTEFYSLIFQALGLGISREQCHAIAYDRTYNVDNYLPFPDTESVVKTLSKTHEIGIISDTWPSIEAQLRSLKVKDYVSFETFSCFLGTFKPDPRMFQDALNKCGCRPEETVFIDDLIMNLEGAAKLGITPILITANPQADVDTSYQKIRSLSELLS